MKLQNNFLVILYHKLEKIKEGTFLKFESGNQAVYKTNFENGIFTVNFSINKFNLITSILFKPYVEESKSNLINGLSAFPTNIGNSIFSLTNNFPNKTQLSIAVLKNGTVNYYSIIIKDNTVKPIVNQTALFEIGSITKVFTSTVLASLIIDEKLKLDNYVNDYYSLKFNNNTKLNFLELANHTSGLPKLPENLDLTHATNPYKNYGAKELNEYLSKYLKIENKNLKKFDYSNLGAGLLGHTLGLSQKQPFNQLLEQRIFKKYKMNNSFTSFNGLENKIVKGLNDKGQEVPNWEFDVLFGGAEFYQPLKTS